jgi:hypothetical protein
VESAFGGEAMKSLRITKSREWIVNIEWDRKLNTGIFSRHKSEAEARSHLRKVVEADPPTRWRIVSVREVRAVLDDFGVGWDADDMDNPPPPTLSAAIHITP